MSSPIYMDVHVPAPISAGLRRRGIDVVTSQDDDATELPDEELLARATELGRVLFSQDDDLQGALDALPDLSASPPQPESLRATGTDNLHAAPHEAEQLGQQKGQQLGGEGKRGEQWRTARCGRWRQ